MEQFDELRFPAVGDCVTGQTVLGGIGWPSRGRPHLHYEIRDNLPDEGGPGYIEGDPLAAGWYHPLAFTSLWQLRLGPGYLASTSFNAVPTLPVRLTGAGGYVLASGERIMAGALGQDSAQWQVETGSIVQGLAALPDGRVVAHTRAGQAMTLAQGRYEALWQVPEPDAPFHTLGETLVFALQGGALEAFNAAGERLWQLPPFPATLQLSDFVSDGTLLAIGLRDPGNGILWRLVDAEGTVRYQANMAQAFPARARGRRHLARTRWPALLPHCRRAAPGAGDTRRAGRQRSRNHNGRGGQQLPLPGRRRPKPALAGRAGRHALAR